MRCTDSTTPVTPAATAVARGASVTCAADAATTAGVLERGMPVEWVVAGPNHTGNDPARTRLPADWAAPPGVLAGRATVALPAGQFTAAGCQDGIGAGAW